MNKSIIGKDYKDLLQDLKQHISHSQYKAALGVNKELILLYHRIGCIVLESQEKHGWGTKIIDQLSKDLKSNFPKMKGFSPRNLKYMRKFAQEYPNYKFVQEVLAQLTWYHNITLLDKISNAETRMFYFNKALENGWSRNVMVT